MRAHAGGRRGPAARALRRYDPALGDPILGVRVVVGAPGDAAARLRDGAADRALRPRAAPARPGLRRRARTSPGARPRAEPDASSPSATGLASARGVPRIGRRAGRARSRSRVGGETRTATRRRPRRRPARPRTRTNWCRCGVACDELASAAEALDDRERGSCAPIRARRPGADPPRARRVARRQRRARAPDRAGVAEEVPHRGVPRGGAGGDAIAPRLKPAREA